MRGKLFTQDFLGEGIAGTAAWRGLGDDEIDRFSDELQRVLHAFPTAGAPNEATTELDLFRAIGQGDPGIGLPPYDGGLFEPAGQPLLDRTRIPDAELAPLLDALARREEAGRRRWINYRDLSVQHLGSIYERLLEFEPVVEADGRVAIRPNPFARKTSGSYYTHDDLVRLILERTVEPLVEKIRDGFDAADQSLTTSTMPSNLMKSCFGYTGPHRASCVLSPWPYPRFWPPGAGSPIRTHLRVRKFDSLLWKHVSSGPALRPSSTRSSSLSTAAAVWSWSSFRGSSSARGFQQSRRTPSWTPSLRSPTHLPPRARSLAKP
jgi:hypothetical protein